MPNCQNCNSKWSWKETLKRSFIIINGMTCPHCGEKQFITARMRKINSIIPTLFIFLTLLGNIVLDFSMISVFVPIGLLLLFTIINPYFVELSNKEEPLF